MSKETEEKHDKGDAGEQEGRVGRTRAATSEWSRYYERAERTRVRSGDPIDTYIRRRRLHNTLHKICLTLALLGVAAAVTALAFSLVGDL